MIKTASLNEGYQIRCDFGTLLIYKYGIKAGIWLKTKHDTYLICGETKDLKKQMSLPFYPDEAKYFMKEIAGNFQRIKEVAESFPEDNDMAYRLCLLAGTPAIEIAEEFPAFSIIIAQLLDKKLTDVQYKYKFFKIIRMKRKHVIGMADFPPENWVIKALKKIPLKECGKDSLGYMHRIIKYGDQDQLKQLRHLKEINIIILKIFFSKEVLNFFEQGFFNELAELNDDEVYNRLDKEITYVNELIKQSIETGIKIPKIRAINDVFSTHQILIQRFTEREFYESCKRLIFVKPPIPGIETGDDTKEKYGIFPINNGAELWEEGHTMMHCIGGYSQVIYLKKGKYYAYHIQVPGEEPATVLIKLKEGKWTIKEINGPENNNVSPKTMFIVRQWLKGNGVDAFRKVKKE